MFNQADIELTDRELLIAHWLDQIIVGISNSVEYTENDSRGVFKMKMERKEVVITHKIDIKSLKNSECTEIIHLFWLLMRTFEKILN